MLFVAVEYGKVKPLLHYVSIVVVVVGVGQVKETSGGPHIAGTRDSID